MSEDRTAIILLDHYVSLEKMIQTLQAQSLSIKELIWHLQSKCDHKFPREGDYVSPVTDTNTKNAVGIIEYTCTKCGFKETAQF